MAFRRSKETAREALAWRRFLQANRDLLAAAGVPQYIYESRELFDDLLMHGHLDHHPDPGGFGIAALDDRQRELLGEAIVRYLRAGFSDPGLGILGSKEHAAIKRRAGVD